MKILFSHSYFMRFDPKQWSVSQPYPPLGTILAAAVLREAGHEVFLFDAQLAESPEEVIPFFEKHKPDVFVIYDDGFNYLTKMCLTNMREAAFEMQKAAKRFGCYVITSSSDSTDHFEEYLNQGADVIIRGEAEMALLEIVEAMAGKKTLNSTEGIFFRENGITVATAKRNVMKELDALPLPAWDLVDMEKYRSVWMTAHGYFSLNMATTRGCPFKCNWCAKPIYGNRYNSRSPEKVVEELLLLQEKFRFDHIWFCDDIFGLKPGWVKTFADLTEEKELRLNYKIQSRADLLVQENYIRDLARSGCGTVWMGAESGSQKILDAMDKGTTVEQIRTATHLLKKHGISPAFFLQFGYPGETLEDIRMTIALLNELLPEDIGISVSYPLPGTKFYDRVKAELKEKQNWTDSDDLALMFRNTYPAGFYRELHRYVHRNYRKHQGYESLKRLLLSPMKVKRSDFRRAAATAFYIPAVISDSKKLKKLANEWS
jgi:anaerobic magnesium-protoporphyrin IX monomethyl ester cyclase